MGGNYFLWVADFNEKNYTINRNNDQVFFSFDNLSLHQFSENKIPLAHPEQKGYSPLIAYNGSNNELCIITDPFGLHYIYISEISENRIACSSHLKYIIWRNPSVLNKLNSNALTEYLFCHSILGCKTLFSDIRLLPYNTILKVINWGNDVEGAIERALKKKRFWFDFPTNYENMDDVTERANVVSVRLTELLEDLFTTQSSKLAFYLSGGLDSRTLVSAIPEKYINSSEALTFDSKLNGIEMKRATSVTNTLKIKHQKQVISADDIVKNCYKHIWLSEGLSNHVVSILLKLIENRIEKKVVIDGFAGDAQFGGEFLPGIENYISKYNNKADRLREIVINHEYSFPRKVFGSIMREEEDNLEEVIRKGFQEHCDLIWPLENDILELETLLVLTRARCYTLGGIRSAENYSPVVLPFYHPEVYTEYIVVPPRLRKKRFLELETLKVLNKELFNISSTSNQWYVRILKFAKYGYKSLSYLESLINKRLIPTYSPVPYFEWMREKGSYRKLVESILEDNNSIIWNILDANLTRKLFTDFFKRKNHLHKHLNHIIDLELILRLFYSVKDNEDEIILVDHTTGEKRTFEVNISLENAKKVTKGQLND
jgi:hypothetical protein